MLAQRQEKTAVASEYWSDTHRSVRGHRYLETASWWGAVDVGWRWPESCSLNESIALWLQLNCPVTVLMTCPDRKTATWAADPIPTDLPGYTLCCHVLGPDQIPLITDPSEVAARLELAALSVMAHGEHPPVVEAFLEAMKDLPDDYALQYNEYVYRLASQAAQSVMEKLMESKTWPVYTPFAKKHFGQGREEGREEGRAEGRAEGEAWAVLTFLRARGIPVSDAVRTRITTCTDVAQLNEWVCRAATVPSAEELFSEQG